MKSLKIGFVLDDTLDTTDGVQQYVLTLGQWLSMQGHDVHYLVGQTSRTDVANVHSLSRNVKVRFNGNRMSMPLPASKRHIRALLAEEQFDALHVQLPYSPLLAGRIVQLAPASTRIVGTFHIAPNAGIVRVATKALGTWSRKSLRRFDEIVSVSTAAQQFAATTYGVQTPVLSNVVAVSDFSGAVPFDDYADKPVIVFLGRLVPRKGCQYLLQAVRLLQVRDVPDYKVIICGKGPLEPELKRYVSQHNLTDQVQFKGFVSEGEKQRYLATADIAVFPSTGGESFGIVLIEAMAANKPIVVGADNEGYRTVLADYPDALVPTEDAEALADRVWQLLTNKEAGERARHWQQSVIDRYDVALVGKKLEQMYQSSTGKSKTVR